MCPAMCTPIIKTFCDMVGSACKCTYGCGQRFRPADIKKHEEECGHNILRDPDNYPLAVYCPRTQ